MPSNNDFSNINNSNMPNLNDIFLGNNQQNNIPGDFAGGMPGSGIPNVGMPGSGMPNMAGIPGSDMPGNANQGQEQDPIVAGMPISQMLQLPKDALVKIIFMQDMKLKELMTDTVPTMLSPGEKVMNKEAVGMADNQLDQLNMQALNMRNGTNEQVKDNYSFEELITIKQNNPELYNYIVGQAASGKIKIDK